MSRVSPKLYDVEDVMDILKIGRTKAREIMSDKRNGFTIRIGRRVFAHKEKFDKWLDRQVCV